MGETNQQRHNDNDIVNLKEEYNVNDNDIVGTKKTNKKYSKSRKVDSLADSLVRKFKAPNSRRFFCKCAWKMSEDEIWAAYEQSHGPRVNNPLKYFITLCSIKMG